MGSNKTHTFVRATTKHPRVDNRDSAYYYTLLRSSTLLPDLQLMTLSGIQRLLVDCLSEHLLSKNRLERGDFMASIFHHKEREFASLFEGAVLLAVDSVRY
jgi:hypothetical protein